MKKIAFLICVVVLSLSLTGCGHVYDPKIDAFEAHLYCLSDDPEGYVNLAREYGLPLGLEDSIVAVGDYIYSDDPSLWGDAVEGWMYLTIYIDELHAELDELHKEYHDAY